MFTIKQVSSQITNDCIVGLETYTGCGHSSYELSAVLYNSLPYDSHSERDTAVLKPIWFTQHKNISINIHNG